jgi:hypothetical protein
MNQLNDSNHNDKVKNIIVSGLDSSSRHEPSMHDVPLDSNGEDHDLPANSK